MVGKPADICGRFQGGGIRHEKGAGAQRAAVSDRKRAAIEHGAARVGVRASEREGACACLGQGTICAGDGACIGRIDGLRDAEVACSQRDRAASA